jgi:hypothetical protein
MVCYKEQEQFDNDDDVEQFHNEMSEIEQSSMLERLIWLTVAVIVYLCLHDNRVSKMLHLKNNKTWSLNVANVVMGVVSLAVAFPFTQHVLKPMLCAL